MEGVIKIESEKAYTLELTGAEIVLIAQLLENQPYKSVSMTINKIENQISNQVIKKEDGEDR